MHGRKPFKVIRIDTKAAVIFIKSWSSFKKCTSCPLTILESECVKMKNDKHVACVAIPYLQLTYIATNNAAYYNS